MAHKNDGQTAQDDRSIMIDVAERLYALSGLDAISFDQIDKEATRHGTQARIEDHFGSQEELFEAIIASRVTPVNERRLELLDALKQKHADEIPPKRDIIEIMARPFLEPLTPNSISYTRRFLYQLRAKLGLLERLFLRRYDHGYRECFRLVRWQMRGIPISIFNRRFNHANAHLVVAGSHLEALLEHYRGKMNQNRIDLHIECAIDSFQAIFEGKISLKAMHSGQKEDENRFFIKAPDISGNPQD